MKQLERQVNAASDEIAELQAKIEGFDIVLHAQGVDIHPDDFRAPIKPGGKHFRFKHGELVGGSLDALRRARRPMGTPEIADELIQRYCLQLPVDRDLIRRRVKNALGIKARTGIVVITGSHGQRNNRFNLWALPEYAGVPWIPPELRTAVPVEDSA
jgi:hypothetical protein